MNFKSNWRLEWASFSLLIVSIILAITIGKSLICKNWFVSIVTMFILFATLLAIILYTVYTKRLTESTNRDIQIRNEPLLSSRIDIVREPKSNGSTKEVHINPTIRNNTGNHAYCYVCLKAIVWGKAIHGNSDYNSEKIWSIYSGTDFKGHVLLSDYTKQMSTDWYNKRLNDYVKKHDKKGYEQINNVLQSQGKNLEEDTPFTIDLLLQSSIGIKLVIELHYFRWDFEFGAKKINQPLSSWSDNDRTKLIVNPPQKYYLQLNNDQSISIFPMTSHLSETT